MLFMIREAYRFGDKRRRTEDAKSLKETESTIYLIFFMGNNIIERQKGFWGEPRIWGRIKENLVNRMSVGYWIESHNILGLKRKKVYL